MRAMRGPWPWILGFALYVWAVEVIFSGGIPRDQLEAVYWGREWVSVSNKHPALSGWVHVIWMHVFGNSALSGHAIGAVNAVLGAGFLTLLLRRMGFARDARDMALWSGFASFNFYLLLIKYNANSAPLTFWLLGLFGLWVGVAERRLWGWILAGLMAGLAMLAKYHTAVWLGVAFLWLLSGPEERRSWRGAGPWLALAIFAAIIVPHLMQLAQWGWPGIGYGAENISAESSIFGHLIEPLRYGFTQILFAAPGLWALIWGVRRMARIGLGLRGRFLLAFGIGFPLAPMVVALVTGGQLGAIWGIGTALLAGPFLLHWCGQAQAVDARLSRLMTRTGQVSFLALALLLAVAQPYRDREYPMARAMQMMEEELGADLARVALVHGTSREAQGATWYLSTHPRFMSATKWEYASWIARHIQPGDLLLIEGDPSGLSANGWHLTSVRGFHLTLPSRDSLLFPTRAYQAEWVLAEVSARPEAAE